MNPKRLIQLTKVSNVTVNRAVRYLGYRFDNRITIYDGKAGYHNYDNIQQTVSIMEGRLLVLIP